MVSKSNIKTLVSFMIILIIILTCGSESTITPDISDQIMSDSSSLSPALLFTQSAIINDLQLTPVEYRLGKEYYFDSVLGSTQVTPEPGAICLWIFIHIENPGDNAQTPSYIFELYYKGEMTYEHTFGVDHPVSYPGLPLDKLYPGQVREGWVLFDVPEKIDLSYAYFTVRPYMPFHYYAWLISSR